MIFKLAGDVGRKVRCAVLLPALAVGLTALAGCGSSSSPSTSASTTSETSAAGATTSAAETATVKNGHESLALAANSEGQLKYDTTSLTADRPGHVTIDFSNMSPLGHNVTVATTAGQVIGATPTIQGTSSDLSLNLKPGTYVFYCSVPGHRMAGMEGKLVVK